MPRLTKTERSEIARLLAGMRKTHAGGRPKVLRPCPKCGQDFGAAELRAHTPRCAGPAKPAAKRARKG